jgi:hypothetical protein
VRGAWHRYAVNYPPGPSSNEKKKKKKKRHCHFALGVRHISRRNDFRPFRVSLRIGRDRAHNVGVGIGGFDHLFAVTQGTISRRYRFEHQIIRLST